MKCPKCGYLNPDTRQQCKHCESPLPLTDAVEVPDWRKEVAQKVKAYGDRKRYLTTPPEPLKQKAIALDEQPETAQSVADAPVATVPRPEPPSKPRREPFAMRQQPPPPDPPVVAAPPKRLFTPPPPPPPKPVEEEVPAELPAMVAPAIEHNQIETWRADVQDVEKESEDSNGLAIDFDSENQFPDNTPDPAFLRALGNRQAAASAGETFFLKRTVAMLIDHFLLIGLYATLVYLYAAVMQEDTSSLLKEAWPALIEIFLLFHLLYYLYFYKSSRQTPGQVFFAIELRDPASVYIPIHKILIRWLVFVLLSILNPLPVLFGKDKFVMDELSGTEIRSLK